MRSLCFTMVLTSAAVLVGACADTDRTAPADTAHPAEHVDSILPREVALERFRAETPDSVAELETPFRTRDALVDAFITRLAARDTAGLATLAMSKAEFAWIYYPTNPIGLPPYDLSPGLMWFQLEGNSRKGFVHALEERGGQDLHIAGYRCEPPVAQGENLIHNQCGLFKVQAPGDTVTEVLFGGIIERHGRFKLIGFTNKL